MRKRKDNIMNEKKEASIDWIERANKLAGVRFSTDEACILWAAFQQSQSMLQDSIEREGRSTIALPLNNKVYHVEPSLLEYITVLQLENEDLRDRNLDLESILSEMS